ncbi:caspase family protein [Halosquirtibacter xylanolyticus]|uniref:caspase family protein n=1 Tax=Halosquirtibacter xylanolyticus TaxID=3374599 RepID=UPI003749B08A|nr:caspase family protein [Prolixibacteraceae bacterium]
MRAFALIIGNNEYDDSNANLNNASNDANDLAARLEELGFFVRCLINMSCEEIDSVLLDIENTLTEYDLVLFFYAGHGFQIENKNYLTARDTPFENITSITRRSIGLDDIISKLNRPKDLIKVIVLDACRNDPFPNNTRGISTTSLAPMFAPTGTIIAFSTSPGQTALDSGSNDRNSIYTEALLNHLEDENISIEEFFKRVRTTVYNLSNKRQTSWEHTSLIGDIFLNSGNINHSIDLPYRDEVIADKNFVSKGETIDDIINNLKTLKWDCQTKGIENIVLVNKNSIDKNYQFLLGRNIVQAAEGNAYSAINFCEDLSSRLNRWFLNDQNHILNGMLFEIYFNNYGRFRKEKFKSRFLKNFSQLSFNSKFKASFDFIQKQLQPFKDQLIYIPSTNPKTIHLEIILTNNETDSIHYVKSVKHQNREFVHDVDDKLNDISFSIEEFKKQLSNKLFIPENLLKISFNINDDSINVICISKNQSIALSK